MQADELDSGAQSSLKRPIELLFPPSNSNIFWGKKNSKYTKLRPKSFSAASYSLPTLYGTVLSAFFKGNRQLLSYTTQSTCPFSKDFARKRTNFWVSYQFDYSTLLVVLRGSRVSCAFTLAQRSRIRDQIDYVAVEHEYVPNIFYRSSIRFAPCSLSAKYF